MAAITSAVIVAAGAAYSADRQRSAANEASRRQAEGVREARQETIEATERARGALTGMAEPERQQIVQRQELDSERQELLDEISSLENRTPSQRGRALHQRRIEEAQGRLAEFDRNRAANESQARAESALTTGTDPAQQPTQEIDSPLSAINPDAQPVDGAVDPLSASQAPPDPRRELMSGILGQLAFTNQGFTGAQETLSPLAAMAAPYLQQQADILGLGGDAARQEAISQISDPLAAEQERAFLRNNAALGGVGGNALSQLAEQTRSRTEANIGNRLAQLSRAGSPSLNALQNISNLRLNQGLGMSDIMGVGARDLSAQETARRQALANLELGLGSELSQLAQNLGTARAGGAAFAAQSPSPLSAGLTAGLGAYSGMGGSFGGFGGFGGGNQNVAMNVQNPNIYGNIA